MLESSEAQREVRVSLPYLQLSGSSFLGVSLFVFPSNFISIHTTQCGIVSCIAIMIIRSC
jgi:hypothetical protein